MNVSITPFYVLSSLRKDIFLKYTSSASVDNKTKFCHDYLVPTLNFQKLYWLMVSTSKLKPSSHSSE